MNALTNKMQLIRRRGKIHFSALDGYSSQWREWWQMRAGRIVEGKRRRYDHVRVGVTLDEVQGDSCPTEFRVAHYAFDCRGWRSFWAGRRWKYSDMSFHYKYPPF